MQGIPAFKDVWVATALNEVDESGVRTQCGAVHQVMRKRLQNPDNDSSNLLTLRICIKKLPALRYEGFDLSSFQVGLTYEVERRLAELLIERGFAEPETQSDRRRATDFE